MPDNFERRSAPLEIRAEPTEDGNVRLIGSAAVFNQESVNLGGFWEIIQPGFFSRILAGDTVAVWDHDDAFVLGRTTASPPTLSLEESSTALESVILAKDNPRNRDWVIDPIGRGEIRHMSFRFRVRKGGDQWGEDDDGRMIRTLLPGGCAELGDVSPVTRPAYLGTDVALRSLEGWRSEHPEAQVGVDVEALRLQALRLQARIQAASYKK